MKMSFGNFLHSFSVDFTLETENESVWRRRNRRGCWLTLRSFSKLNCSSSNGNNEKQLRSKQAISNVMPTATASLSHNKNRTSM